MDGPYRSSTAIPRYLCIVCYRSLSQLSGRPAVAVASTDRSSSPEVREQVRLRRRSACKKDVQRVLDPGAHLGRGRGAGDVVARRPRLHFVPPVTMVVARAYAALKRNSAIATFAAAVAASPPSSASTSSSTRWRPLRRRKRRSHIPDDQIAKTSTSTPSSSRWSPCSPGSAPARRLAQRHSLPRQTRGTIRFPGRVA